MRPPEVFVREPTPEEGARLKSISKRAKYQSKRQRAIILLASSTGMPAPQIAGVVRSDESHVRKVIHAFNDRGFASLRSPSQGTRPPGGSIDRRATAPRPLRTPRSDSMLTRCRSRRRPTNTRSLTKLIDRIRHNIQERLDQLLAEVEKLRHALAALDPRERPASKPKPAKSKPAAKRPVRKATSTKPTPARTPTRAASSANGSATSTRTAPGETRAKVLAALSSDGALTAADVANATGLARPTVSTTLSRLANSGEAVKADRGYRLPSTGEGATPAEPAAEEAKTEA